ncbi:MAG: hypothetical protein GF364_01990, partial [Candidatus Lokiarchaeota archaeon]|nr:hypothetical protein [Candidatus Lokiarchaeota archaeon]
MRPYPVMRYKKRKSTKSAFRYILLISLIFVTISLSMMQFASIFGKSYPIRNELGQMDDIQNEINPESSYLPLNPDGNYPVGNVSILEITQMEDAETSVPFDAIFYGNISYSYEGFDFLGTVDPASEDRIDWNQKESYITIRVNETAKFIYWYNYTAMEVGILPEMTDGIIREVTVNGTQINLSNITTSGGGFLYN